MITGDNYLDTHRVPCLGNGRKKPMHSVSLGAELPRRRGGIDLVLEGNAGAVALHEQGLRARREHRGGGRVRTQSFEAGDRLWMTSGAGTNLHGGNAAPWRHCASSTAAQGKAAVISSRVPSGLSARPNSTPNAGGSTPLLPGRRTRSNRSSSLRATRTSKIPLR